MLDYDGLHWFFLYFSTIFINFGNSRINFRAKFQSRYFWKILKKKIKFLSFEVGNFYKIFEITYENFKAVLGIISNFQCTRVVPKLVLSLSRWTCNTIYWNSNEVPVFCQQAWADVYMSTRSRVTAGFVKTIAHPLPGRRSTKWTKKWEECSTFGSVKPNSHWWLKHIELSLLVGVNDKTLFAVTKMPEMSNKSWTWSTFQHFSRHLYRRVLAASIILA